MIIKFGEDTDVFTWSAVLEGLGGWTLRLEYTEPGFPRDCAIDSASRDSLVVCDVDDIGRPMPHSLYHVPYDVITSVTVI